MRTDLRGDVRGMRVGCTQDARGMSVGCTRDLREIARALRVRFFWDLTQPLPSLCTRERPLVGPLAFSRLQSTSVN